jgi:hypothetical protein
LGEALQIYRGDNYKYPIAVAAFYLPEIPADKQGRNSARYSLRVKRNHITSVPGSLGSNYYEDSGLW